MRLVCPNCGAQYEVPDEVIPQSGRDVQCSNCGDTWFQNHPDNDPELAEELGEALVQEDSAEEEQPEPAPTVEEPPAPPLQRKRELDPSVTDVLREEAAREAEARKRETGPLEEQPDLGIGEPDDEAARRQREASERMSRMRGEDPPAAKSSAAMATAGSRRDVLPDIDEINSTLRKDSERRKTATEVAASREAEPRKSGFLRGFIMMLLIAVVLVLLYVFAPQISSAVPALAPVMESYVSLVNEARTWLDATVRGLMGTLDGMASEGATPAETVGETPAPSE